MPSVPVRKSKALTKALVDIIWCGHDAKKAAGLTVVNPAVMVNFEAGASVVLRILLAQPLLNRLDSTDRLDISVSV